MPKAFPPFPKNIISVRYQEVSKLSTSPLLLHPLPSFRLPFLLFPFRVFVIVIAILLNQSNLPLGLGSLLLHRSQQALIIPHHLAHGLLDLVDPFGPLQLHQHVLVLLVHPLLDQQAPVVVRAIVGIARLGPLCQPSRARLARMGGDAAEQVELDQAVELARR